MFQHQRMQSHRGAQERNDFHLRLHAVDMQEGSLALGFMAVDRQVTSVHPQSKGNGMELAEFDPSASKFFRLGDHPPAHHALERIGRDIPGEQAEGNGAENPKAQEEPPQNAPALRRGRFALDFARRFAGGLRRLLGRLVRQRFCSPALDSGGLMWLPERRLASHPESSSFIFFSASRSLMWPKTSVNGVARLPAFFISGNNWS